jgi:hypothetical protein
MLKRLAIFAVLLTIAQASMPISGQASNNRAPDQQNKNNAGQRRNQPAKPIFPGTIPQKKNGPALENKGEERPADHEDAAINITNPTPVSEPWHWYEKVAWVANLLLVVVGIGGVIIGVVTLIKIERQTKAGEDAAEAALLSARALINSERPWILITIEPFKGNQDVFAITAKNCGRTPARLLSYSTPLYSLIPSGSALPKEPQYGNLIALIDALILLTGETREFEIVSEDAIKEVCEDEETYGRVWMGTDSLYVFGKIYYQDLLDSTPAAIHVTGWCCQYLPAMPTDRLILHGPTGYNRHT